MANTLQLLIAGSLGDGQGEVILLQCTPYLVNEADTSSLPGVLAYLSARVKDVQRSVKLVQILVVALT
jgi:hypothetical protein